MAGDSPNLKAPWEHVLYKKQAYADNYVPDSFLQNLRANGACFA